jgi:hypothetical protein
MMMGIAAVSMDTGELPFYTTRRAGHVRFLTMALYVLVALRAHTVDLVPICLWRLLWNGITQFFQEAFVGLDQTAFSMA